MAEEQKVTEDTVSEEVKSETAETEEVKAEKAETSEEETEKGSGLFGKNKKKDRKTDKKDEELEKLRKELGEEKYARLRLAAEYDNYRKRTTKEKDNIYRDAVGDTVKKILPIYDNLERALAQETADEAYKKGVEMIMTAMKETLSKCGVEPFGEPGEPFDPEMHNAVMHIEDENLGENVIADVFQKGFRSGDKIIRFAMVRVAN